MERERERKRMFGKVDALDVMANEEESIQQTGWCDPCGLKELIGYASVIVYDECWMCDVSDGDSCMCGLFKSVWSVYEKE